MLRVIVASMMMAAPLAAAPVPTVAAGTGTGAAAAAAGTEGAVSPVAGADRAAPGAAQPLPEPAGSTQAPTQLGALVAELPAASYDRKAELFSEIAQLRGPLIKPLLAALLNEQVYSRERDKKVFMVQEVDAGYALTDPLSGKPAGTESSDDFDEVGINDRLRTVLEGLLAQLDLSSPSAGVRLAAVQQMLHAFDYSTGGTRNAAVVALLRAHLASERSAAVRRAIDLGLALADLSHGSPERRLAAIDLLASSMNPDVYNRLVTLTDPSSEADPAVRRAAAHALRRIDDWRSFYGAIQTLLFGLGLGSVLALAAIGLAITFGVMGIINMAHGELMMLGAYTTYVMQLLMPSHIGASLVIAVPAAFVVSGLFGVVIERGIVRFLYGRPLETLLATFGVSLALQQLVRDLFTANNRPVAAPAWMTGSLEINEALSITYNRLVIVLFTLALFAALLVVLRRTRLGLQVRAVSQNRAMARAMGVRTEWVDALTFGLGSGIAGVAGVALSQITNVGPNLGQSYIVDSFMVVVFGGVGNLWGTLIGGMSLGVVDKILEPYAGAVLGKVLVLVAVILFIQRRPRGLYPQKGRAAEV